MWYFFFYDGQWWLMKGTCWDMALRHIEGTNTLHRAPVVQGPRVLTGLHDWLATALGLFLGCG